jgi:PKD repeat protein
VNFTSLSQGDIDTHVWDFGDSQESTDRDPTHVYRKPGTYSVMLKVFGANATQDTMVKEDCITVTSRCAVSQSLDAAEAIVVLRVLRNVLLTNPSGLYLVSRYYQYTEEISGLLERNEGLQQQFKQLLHANISVAKELTATGEAEVSTAQVEKLLVFLNALSAEAGLPLQNDIDVLIHGIEAGYVLTELGIRIE